MSLPKKLLAQLSRLKLQSRYCFSSKFKGEHQSTKHGAGLEFADYRAYQLGDELSHVDWNLYARSRRSFVKVFQFESDLTVTTSNPAIAAEAGFVPWAESGMIATVR